jgi:hypothetical protein
MIVTGAQMKYYLHHLLGGERGKQRKTAVRIDNLSAKIIIVNRSIIMKVHFHFPKHIQGMVLN